MDRTSKSRKSRRLLILLACGLAGSAGLAAVTSSRLSASPGAAQVYQPTPAARPQAEVAWTRDDAAHLLRRAGFGGTPEQIDRLYALGRNGAVEYLLGGSLPAGTAAPFESVALEPFKPEGAAEEVGQVKAGQNAGTGAKGKKARQAALARFAGAGKRAAANAANGANAANAGNAANPALTAKKAARKMQAMARRQEVQQLRDWWIERMVRTDRPLEEKMSLFWHGLFTSGFKEVKSADWMVQQNALFHREALGNYRTLTHAVVHDPAMLKYLNNDENVKGKPNENLARELMELFTMGEGNGYTEADIGQVARALTGLAPVGKLAGAARMRQNLHDEGPKTIFGKSGNFGPNDVVDLIFARPQPAQHLAKKLWEFFAYPNPGPAELKPVEDALTRNNFDVKPALRAIFTSPAFYSEKAKFALIKSPVEVEVGTARNLGLSPGEREARFLEQQLTVMDQELLQPPNVRGWVGGDNWITAATLYSRYNTACAMVNGTLGGGMKGMAGGKGAGKAGKAGKANGGAAAAPAAAGDGADEAPAEAPKGPGLDRPAALGMAGDRPGAVSPAKLFPGLPQNPTAEQVVDAAVSRFLQRPLHPEKRAALLQTLNDAPIKLGTPESDKRVREMIGLLLSTPEYQVH